MPRPLLLLALVVLAAAPLHAQFGPTDSARVALVTIAPGDDVYSRWGHTAIRIDDPTTGFDALYNYGTFEFDRWFVFSFAYGKLDYLLSVWPTPRAYALYIQVENRSIIEQTLRLTPAETRKLYTLLETNALPENRVYRYDFLFDNCSTRPRDVIEAALGTRLVPPTRTPHTFRDLIDPFLREVPALDTGLDVLLGLPVDARATEREATFLPDTLFAWMEKARVQTADGQQHPLVVRTDTVYWAGPAVPPVRAFPWHTLVIAGIALGGLWATWQTRRRAPGQWLRWMDALLFGVLGVVGLLLAFLWFVSLHHVTGPNLNVLWAWPTHLAAAGIALRRTLPRWGTRYFQATALVTGAALVVWPLLPQALPWTVWPLALLAAVRAWARNRQP